MLKEKLTNKNRENNERPIGIWLEATSWLESRSFAWKKKAQF